MLAAGDLHVEEGVFAPTWWISELKNTGKSWPTFNIRRGATVSAENVS